MSLIIFLYTALIVYFLIKKAYFVALAIFLTIPFLVLFLILRKRTLIKRYKKEIDHAFSLFSQNAQFEPFFNLNKAPYYLIELIPGVKKSDALKIVNLRKVQDKSIADFGKFKEITALPLSLHKFVEKILIF